MFRSSSSWSTGQIAKDVLSTGIKLGNAVLQHDVRTLYLFCFAHRPLRLDLKKENLVISKDLSRCWGMGFGASWLCINRNLTMGLQRHRQKLRL